MTQPNWFSSAKYYAAGLLALVISTCLLTHVDAQISRNELDIFAQKIIAEQLKPYNLIPAWPLKHAGVEVGDAILVTEEIIWAKVGDFYIDKFEICPLPRNFHISETELSSVNYPHDSIKIDLNLRIAVSGQPDGQEIGKFPPSELSISNIKVKSADLPDIVGQRSYLSKSCPATYQGKKSAIISSIYLGDVSLRLRGAGGVEVYKIKKSNILLGIQIHK